MVDQPIRKRRAPRKKAAPDTGDPRWVRPSDLPHEIAGLEVAARAVAAAPDDRAAKEALRAAATAVKGLARTYGKTNPDLRDETECLLAEVQAAVERARVSKVEKAIYYWAYHRDRIAGERSKAAEQARGHIAQQKADAANVPWVVGFRWIYDPRKGHRCDICAKLARANDFGLGAGGYPKNRVPELPGHDGCTCYFEDIIDESVDPTEAEWASMGLPSGLPVEQRPSRTTSRRSAWTSVGVVVIVLGVLAILGAVLRGLLG